ncbi:MAG: glycosyltransferase family 39 protein [Anaerolineae bacterium]
MRHNMTERPANARATRACPEPCPERSRRGSRRVLILSLIILAFALRVYQLDAKSIWLDESHSLNRATLDLLSVASSKQIFGDRIIQDKTPHLPFYFIVLHFLIKLAGDSDFTLRFLSVIFGVLTVPLIYFMGKKLCRGHARVGLWAALLATFSPFYLWYSQEARMYTLLVFLGLLSVYCLLRAIGEDKAGWYATYAVTATAMLYTSLSSFGMFAFEGLLGLLAAWKRRRWVILAVFVIILLALLPGLWPRLVWVGPERPQLEEYNYWPRILLDILNSLNFGLSLDPSRLTLPNLALLVIFIIGLLSLVWDRPFDAAQDRPFDAAQGKAQRGLDSSLLLLGYVSIPIISLYLASQLLQPMYRGSRYLIIISPAYYLGLAAGLLTIKRRARLIFLLCLSLILGGMLLSDYNYFFSPDYHKEDYRSVARHVEEHSQVGDVIVGASFDSGAFRHYYRGHLPMVWLPRPGKDMVTDMQEMARQYDRIWLLSDRLFEHDPQGRVRAWLDNNLFKTTSMVFHSYGSSPTLLAYLTTSPLLDRLPAVRYPLEASFGGKIALRGYDLPLGVPPAGERLCLTLYLQAEQTVEEDYKVSVRLVDGEGHLWGQYDNPPLNGAFPTSQWSPETIVREWCDVPIQPGTPPGTYWLEVRMYRPGTAEDLDVLVEGESQGKAVTLGQVEVSEPTSAASPAEVAIQHHLKANWGDRLRLLGYDLASRAYQPGDGLVLSLYYQAASPPKKDYLLRLQLVDKTGTVLAEGLSSPGGETYPTSRWKEGVMIKSQHGLTIPPDATGGRLKLRASLVDPEGEPLPVRPHPWPWTRKHLDLTAVRVSDRERSYQLPPIEHAMRADLGDQVEFHGYSLESAQVEPGSLVRLTLYWRTRQRMTVSYTVFTHLLGKDEGIWGQRDNIPVKGTYPTTGWVEGEVITDEYEIAIKSDAPPGEYQIEVGMYDAGTGQRLPVFDEGETRLSGDRIPLDQVITVR